jgi:maltoporin
VEVTSYGRVGLAWALTGPQIIQGKSMNLTGNSQGGRFEEGDYIEMTAKAHILKSEDKDGTYIDMAITPALWAKNGSLIGAFSNGFPPGGTLSVELFQAFIEAGNVFLPGLTFWGGSRFYRGGDIHIADYFYFNNLSAQGGGAKYKGIDLAILSHTTVQGNPLYNIDINRDGTEDVERTRTIFVGQYTHNLGMLSSSVQGLAEFHMLPPVRRGDETLAPGDYGYVVGAKLHLDFDKGNFNDTSLRYGTRIANGAFGGGSTFGTYGLPDPVKNNYDGAAGVEFVEHFLFNFPPFLTLNGYGVFHFDKGASGTPEDKGIDFAVGARSIVYAHKNFHMVNELTFQGVKNGDQDLGTAVKFSVVPTIVPSGELSAWARPHMRLIYTAGFYNQAAVDQRMSPYLRDVSTKKVAHYLGARTEWWF